MIIGITGKICSGKSVIIKEIENKYNVILLSTDIIAKRMIEQGECPFDITNNDLSNDQFIKIKNEFHPLVWAKIKNIIDTTKSKLPNEFVNKINFIIETALPSEKFFEIVDKSIYIYSDDKDIKDRINKNRKYSDNKINNIITEQNNYIDFYNKCDYIIYNNESLKDFKIKFFDVFCKLLGEH